MALSLESPPPGVTRHRAFMEPGLSSPDCFRATGAAARPTGSMGTKLLSRQGQGAIWESSPIS